MEAGEDDEVSQLLLLLCQRADNSFRRSGDLLLLSEEFSDNIKKLAHLALPCREGQVAWDPSKLRGMPRLANPHQRPLVAVDHLAAMRESQAVLVAEAAFGLVVQI